MLKVQFTDARIKVKGHWTSEGSALAGTISSQCHGIEVEIDVESEESPDRVAALVHNARGGCYAESLIRHPVPISGDVRLNGDTLDYESYPAKIERR